MIPAVLGQKRALVVLGRILEILDLLDPLQILRSQLLTLFVDLFTNRRHFGRRLIAGSRDLFTQRRFDSLQS